MNVFFVDDEEGVLENYKLFFEFEEEDWTIHTFCNPLDALKAIEQSTPDVCFIDYRMPQMMGPELRAKIPKEIPCFLVTGELGMEQVEGFELVIHKPNTFDAIEAVLAKMKQSSAA